MIANETEDSAAVVVDTTITPILYPWQQDAWNRVVQQVEHQHLPHATLLKSAEGEGLISFALLLAHLLLCNAPKNKLPCGQCRDCHLLSVGTHPGFSIIRPEPNKKTGIMSKMIIVDQIRDVIDTVNQTSFNNGRKVLVIAPSDVMNPAAANALLKSLEEPPVNTFFILTSQNSARLMATIRSRCQIIDLPAAKATDADHWLENRIPDANQRMQLLAMSGNNPLLVARWQDDNEIDMVLKLAEELRQVLLGKLSPVQLAATWYKNDLPGRIGWWWRWLALELKSADKQKTVEALPVSAQTLLAFMHKLLVAKRQLESSANPNEQLLLESLLIDWQQLKHN